MKLLGSLCLLVLCLGISSQKTMAQTAAAPSASATPAAAQSAPATQTTQYTLPPDKLAKAKGLYDLRGKLRAIAGRAELVEGASLSKAMSRQAVFPALMLDMMSVGEQTGRFADTMQMIADVYERELDKQVKIATALLLRKRTAATMPATFA